MVSTRGFHFSLFLFFSLLYLITTPGHFYTLDSIVSYETTVSLVTRGSLEISGSIITVPDAEGKPTGRYGLLQMILCIPFYLVGVFLEKMFGTPGFLYESWPVTVVATFNQWVSGAALVLFFGILRRLGYPARRCFAAALVFGLATPWWTYSRDLFRQPIAGFLFLWAVYEALLYGGEMRNGPLLRFGTAVGLSVTNRITAAVAWPGMFFLLLSRIWNKNSRRMFRILFVVAALVVLGVLLQIAVNYWRFHHWWGRAYDNRIFKLSFLSRNIPDLLLSPARGVFLFAPPLLLIGHGFVATWKKDRGLAFSIFLMVAAKLLLFGTYYDYTGGMNPGPRYLIPILPILFLPIGVLICEGWSERALRWSVYGLAGLGGIVNGYNSLTAYPYTLTFWEQILSGLGVGPYAPRMEDWNPLSEFEKWKAGEVFHDVLIGRWLIDGHFAVLFVFLAVVGLGLLVCYRNIRPVLDGFPSKTLRARDPR